MLCAFSTLWNLKVMCGNNVCHLHLGIVKESLRCEVVLPDIHLWIVGCLLKLALHCMSSIAQHSPKYPIPLEGSLHWWICEEWQYPWQMMLFALKKNHVFQWSWNITHYMWHELVGQQHILMVHLFLVDLLMLHFMQKYFIHIYIYIYIYIYIIS
jgi:hypothetical protein